MAKNRPMFRQHEARSQWEVDRTEYILIRKEREKNAQIEEDDVIPITAIINAVIHLLKKQGKK